MLNNYTPNYIPMRKTSNLSNVQKISNPSNQAKQRASSTNIDKMKSQVKVIPYESVIKKTNNHILKSISVNKQIQYQKKNLIKNSENEYSNSYNGINGFKNNYININNNMNNNNI